LKAAELDDTDFAEWAVQKALKSRLTRMMQHLAADDCRAALPHRHAAE
jgi:hypothetical protein